MKTVYTNMKKDDHVVPWTRLMLNNVARPRAIMNLWLAFHKKLVKKDMLMKFCMMNNSKCAFYNKDETIDHLFFECDVMKRIWRKVLK